MPQTKRRNASWLSLLVLASAAAVSGCWRGHLLPRKELLVWHPSVRWVYRTGGQLGMLFYLPIASPSSVSDLAQGDRCVIVTERAGDEFVFAPWAARYAINLATGGCCLGRQQREGQRAQGIWIPRHDLWAVPLPGPVMMFVLMKSKEIRLGRSSDSPDNAVTLLKFPLDSGLSIDCDLVVGEHGELVIAGGRNVICIDRDKLAGVFAASGPAEPDSWVERALIEKLEDDNEILRWSAARDLGRLRARSAVAGLVRTLKDPSASVRDEAAEALGLIADRRAVGPLIESTQDEDRNVRSSAVRALAGFDDRRAFEAILAGSSDPDFRVRLAAAEALAEEAPDRAVEPLIALLRDDSDVVRLVAVFGLAKLRASAALEPLGVLGRNDPDRCIRRQALIAIDRIRGTGKAQ